MHEAKSGLSKLVRELRDGVERKIVIAANNQPVAYLIAYEAAPVRPLGMDEGLYEVPGDLAAPDAQAAALFESGDLFPPAGR